MINFTWKKTNAPEMSAGRTDDIWFQTKDIGWAINSNGQIMHTKDGGISWTDQLRINNAYLRCISFSNPQNGWVGSVTAAKRLHKTQNAGISWEQITNLPPLPNAICGICAVNNSVVYAAGTNYPNRPCGVLKTTDGGQSWTHIDMSAHANLLVDIYFVDANKGWVVGGFGGSKREEVKPVVLHTENGGVTWTNQVAAIQAGLPLGEWGWKIQFLDANVGFVSLENFEAGAILKTTDGGQNWNRIIINDPQKNANLEGIGFLDENTGWAGGWGDRDFNGGFTSETNDGGVTWKNANYVGKYINRFRFIGNPLEVAYASGQTVYKYSDSSEVFLSAADKSMAKNRLVRNLIANTDSDVYSEKIPIVLNVPEGTENLTLHIWDRFGELVATLLDEKQPTAGERTVMWKFPESPFNAKKYYYIIRVSTDKNAESKIIAQRS